MNRSTTHHSSDSSTPPGPLLRRSRLLLVGVLAVVAVAAVVGAGVQQSMRSGGTTDPRSDSDAVARLVERDAPGLAPNLVVLVDAAQGVDAPSARTAGLTLQQVLGREPGAEAVTSYWTDRDPRLRSADGRYALLTAHLRGEESDIADTMDRLRPALLDAQDTLEVRLAGPAVVRETIDKTIARDLQRAEVIALPITFLILLVVFGGFWAALLPLCVGVFAIVATNAVLRLIAGVTDVSVFALNLTTALGLGLAVDYALLMVRRYREEASGGRGPAEALRHTMGTAGRTVAFSGLTVATSLAAMLVFPLYFLRSFAYAGVSVVVASMVGALVVLPALMLLLHRRLERPGRVARLMARRSRGDGGPGGWSELAHRVTRRARVVAPVSVAALLLLAAPFGSVRFGTSDERQLQTSTSVREAQRVIDDQFPLAAPPLAVVALDSGTTSPELGRAASRAGSLPGVTGTRVLPSDGGSLLLVASRLDPEGDRAQDLVHRLRVELPSSEVGGATATLVDTKNAIGERLPLALLIVLLAAMVLVFVLTGSALLPLVTVLGNGLSLTAMFGAMVWVFQEGHLSGLLGFTATGTIDTALPPLMACVAFGLSMDYGVFVLARVVEERARGGDTSTVLARALQRTGGIVTAAALILSTVLVAIGTSSITNTKMLGLGVALAVLIDAAVVRCVVMPSVLVLLGRAAWWAPGPLRTLHSRIGWREELPPVREPAPATAAGGGVCLDLSEPRKETHA